MIENLTSFLHTCGELVDLRKRTVIVEPGDKSWPKDVEAEVLYCMKCECFVSVYEVSRKGEGIDVAELL